MSAQQPKKSQGLPNPYATGVLPNPYAASAASAAPVKYADEQAKTEQPKKAPATLFHNPHSIKRPQPKKPGPAVKRGMIPKAASSAADTPASAHKPQNIENTLDYYRSTADDDAAIIEERRQRNRAEKQRKKELKKFQKQYGFWNPQAPHRPQRYSNLKAYRASGAYKQKTQDFNAFLRNAVERHSELRRDSDSPDVILRESSSSSKTPSFAEMPSSALPASSDPPNVPGMLAEEDPYAHRMRLSQMQTNAAASSTLEPPKAQVPSPDADVRSLAQPAIDASLSSLPSATSAPAAVYQNATISAPPVRYSSAIISAPPVRYEQPDFVMRDADAEHFQETERPTKKIKLSKAEAMMAKMGYKKGQGLGKNNDGVITHLEVKMRKVPQGAGSIDENGDKIKGQQVWDVRGGHREKQDEPNKFGVESTVIVAWGCTEGIDWKLNAQRDDGGVRQDMGSVFSGKFGDVERIHIDEANADGVVYVKFQSILAALNAVNRFDEGFTFRGRTIRAQYYDERKFNAGIWDY